MVRQILAKTGLALLVYLLSGGCASTGGAQPQGSPMGPTLYKRLGGYDAIAAVTDDFIGRLAADKQLSRFLVGLSVDSQKKLRQHVVDQLCEATGGPCLYTGRAMKAAHGAWNYTG